ncbi:MAG: DUF2939 domain-containing protein [Alphaproteobacteria bacterium]
MRKIAAAIIVLVVLFAAWSAWPFFGVYALARAVQSGDIAKIEERVDYGALGRSLSGQILATYARQTGLPLDRGLIGNLASAVADPLIAKILSRVALAQFLQNGWPTPVLGERPPAIPAPNWNALGDVWQLYGSARYGLRDFSLRLPVNEPRARQYLVNLRLEGLTWKLTGFELPDELADRLARELVKQKAG